MEQTAGLADLHRESPAEEFESYFRAASHLADSFLKGQSAPQKVHETIGGYPEGAREQASRIFLEKIVLGMELKHCREVAAAVRLFQAGGEGAPAAGLEQLDQEYRGKIGEAQAQAEKGRFREQLLAPLHQAGISGSALAEVNLERSPVWEGKLDGIAQGYRPQLALLKEQLLAAIKKRG